MPVRSANCRKYTWSVASSLRGGGLEWSMKTTDRDGFAAFTRSIFSICRNVRGAGPSSAYDRSTFAIVMSPARTGWPDAWERTFSTIVCPGMPSTVSKSRDTKLGVLLKMKVVTRADRRRASEARADGRVHHHPGEVEGKKDARGIGPAPRG